MARYLIGIDLGTTNSALAYVDLDRTPRAGHRVDIKPFAVPQLVAAGEARDRPLLPSFLYLPGEHDLPAGATALPWDAERRFAVGEFARNHGGKVPGRLVASAKSWLCHPGVDRTSSLLPWSAPPDVPRLSPVEASTRCLRHFVEAWNHAMAKGRDDHRLEEQTVVLTVPASFDDVARTLTMEAATKAGLKDVHLLEEPQAAFYCWLATHPPAEATRLKPGSYCLVVDVGGGTTDFSLIKAVEEKGELAFVREAVGDHLLLGGDNMDLALAKFVETKLPQAGRLDATQYALLTQACRAAKEALLGEKPPSSQTVTVIGRGRSVIGGTLHAPLTPDDVKKVIFDGFFPHSGIDEKPTRGAKGGLHEMGLPYVSDPGITRHMAAFLHAHARPGERLVPASILFNGGVFTPSAMRSRLLEVLHSWYGSEWTPLVLTNPSLDLAVALGAAYFGWLRHIGGKRIGGGIPRSYYVGLGGEEKEARTVVCVAPQQMEEGQEIAIPRPELELALGQPVAFPLFTSTARADDRAGDVLEVEADQLMTLPALTTVLRGGKRAGAKHVPVTLHSRSTAIGTLELHCVAKEGGNRWRLEFNLRDLVKEQAPRDDASEGQGVAEVWVEEQVQAAGEAVRRCYADRTPPLAPADLTRALEGALEATRSQWPMTLCRRLWDFLLETAEGRRKSPAHLMRWLNLAGHVLRPGFGDSLDRFRIDQLWKLIAAPPRQPGQAASRAVEGGAEYWILWRRVAGGLGTSLQNALYDRLRPTLLPAKNKAFVKPNPNELAEMWRAAASLERLPTGAKEGLGHVLAKQLQKAPTPSYGFWAMTRLGARGLLYGPMNCIIHPETVQGWLGQLVGFVPSSESEKSAWLFCLAQLARRTGQRALDIDEPHQQAVLSVLRRENAPPHSIKMVEEVTELEREEQGQMLGDALPVGLRLLKNDE
ncbi:MAG: hsp70 family protein [Gemmataceae bacterium]|nr:hsp70 family protein [Gemmataceae bacterium]